MTSASSASSAPTFSAHAARSTIDRDEFGVPHISGVNEADVEYALAYAMAEDGFAALEDAYATALGRAGAYYGSERAEGDRLRSSLSVTIRASAELAAMPAGERALLQAFTDGLNAYVQDHASTPPRHIARFEPWMVVAYANDAVWVQALARGIAVPPDTSDRLTLAVAARNGGAASILLVASHDALPYEMHVHSSDGFAFRGFTTLGLPFAREGFSDRVAYGAIEYDVRSSLIAVDTSGNSARLRAGHTDTLALNTQTGVIQVVGTSLQTADGPVVSMRNDSAIVMRASAIPRGVVHTMRAMMHATDRSDLSAVAPPQATHGGADRIDARDDSRGTSVFAPGRQEYAEALLRADTGWTIQKVIHLAFDTHVVAAAREIAALVDEWEQVGARNPEKAQALDSAVAILRGWNRVSTIESTAMTLYAELVRGVDFETAGSFRRFSAFEALVQDGRRFPTRPWGAVNAIRRSSPAGAKAMPVAGAPLRTSTLFTYDAQSRDQFYVWAVDLRSGVAGSVLSYGSSYDAGSPHWFDQAPLFAAGSLKSAAVRQAGGGHPYHPGESH